MCPSFCVSHRRTSPLCGLVGRDVCVPHFVSLTGVPAFIVRSCRERRVCPSFCVSHRHTSPLCGLVGRDVCVPHFVSLTGVLASIFHPSSMNYNMSIIISIFMQERSPYIITLKMNGSELLFVYNNVEMVAAFVVYLLHNYENEECAHSLVLSYQEKHIIIMDDNSWPSK